MLERRPLPTQLDTRTGDASATTELDGTSTDALRKCHSVSASAPQHCAHRSFCRGAPQRVTVRTYHGWDGAQTDVHFTVWHKKSQIGTWKAWFAPAAHASTWPPTMENFRQSRTCSPASLRTAFERTGVTRPMPAGTRSSYPTAPGTQAVGSAAARRFEHFVLPGRYTLREVRPSV